RLALIFTPPLRSRPVDPMSPTPSGRPILPVTGNPFARILLSRLESTAPAGTATILIRDDFHRPNGGETAG
ncbi:MAG: hypothetical protein ACE5ID_12230, partial [Acidobacteriota bacterium]